MTVLATVDHHQGSARPAFLSIARLALTRFRCYESVRLSPDERPVVLSGPNGAGKTNLLEAISLLTPGRGLRRARLIEIDRQGGAGGWGVAANVVSSEGAVEIGTGREADGERRIVRINGETARGQTALADFVSALWLTPDMDRLFREGASARRRFLDRLVYGFDPAHAGRVSAYEQAMRERARLLAEGNRDDGWLSALEDTMAARGIAIAAARLDIVQRLTRALAVAAGPFPGVALSVDGMVEELLASGPALSAEEELKAVLRTNRRHDARNGTTTAGSHRSDLVARHLTKDMPADLCSTGEQKAMLIAIVLAEARLQAAQRGVAPLLLLDEVAAHLDDQRRRALFDVICDLPGQTWMTGTDATLFAPLRQRAQHYSVADATVTPIN